MSKVMDISEDLAGEAPRIEPPRARRRLACLLAGVVGLAAAGVASAANWPSAGQDLTNSHNQPQEFQIGPGNVANLQVKWSVATSGDVVSQPALDDQYAYFPDSAGFIYKVSRATGAVVWKLPVSNYTGITGDYARSTPAISGNTLVFGNQSGKFVAAFHQPTPQPAQVFAVDKNTGAKLWSTQVDSNQLSAVTAAPVVVQGLVLTGVASQEELYAGFAPGWQFSFRGSVVALDVNTGAIRWKTYTVPPGYFGGAVWGSTIAFDVLRQEAYAATGNNYAVPQSVLDCLNKGSKPTKCLDPADHFDSVIALSLADGSITWSQRGVPYDAFNVGCGLYVPYVFNIQPNNNCPNPTGPDWDFAQGPMLLGGPLYSFLNSHVGGGEKSGVFWSFDRNTGKVDWMTQVAPGGLTGGLQWGSATDGQRIYVAVSNAGLDNAGNPPIAQTWTLPDGTTTPSGGWAALDSTTGKILWALPDPKGSRAEAPVAVANGVVYGCNLDPANGTMYALNAATGAVLWSHNSGGACEAGASIADGVVYWGTGNGQGYGPHQLFAFSLGGQ
jgi:polyvinyl alcohol dehydrogenase (cytochrome)